MAGECSVSSMHNVVTLLAKVASDSPERTAIALDLGKGKTERIDFLELLEKVNRLGASLKKQGIAPGDRLVCMVPMSIDLYVVLLAILKVGGAVIFVDPWISRKKIADFAAFAQPSGFVGIGKSHLLRLLDCRLRKIRLSITTGSAYFGWLAKAELGQLLMEPAEQTITPVELEATALITFTTGSSGTPKGANRTHGYLLSQHQALQSEFPYHDDDV